MTKSEFTDEQRGAMLGGIDDRRGEWGDLNPALEIARIGAEVGLNRDEPYDLLKHLLDEDLVYTRFLRAGDDVRLGNGVGQRNLMWDGNEVRPGHDLRLTTTGRSVAEVE